MACVAIPLVLRAFILALHIQSAALIGGGKLNMPDYVEKKEDLVMESHFKALIWLLIEIMFCILSLIMLITTVIGTVMPHIDNLPSVLGRIRLWFSENCPYFNFFYYLVLSPFVLYTATMGCGLPGVFHQVPDRTERWQGMIIAAIACGVINSVLYVLTAFFPVKYTHPNDDEKYIYPYPLMTQQYKNPFVQFSQNLNKGVYQPTTTTGNVNPYINPFRVTVQAPEGGDSKKD